MPPLTEFQELLQQIAKDGMVTRKVIAEAEDVVFLKSVIEAYPGVAAVHAERGQKLQGWEELERPRELTVATSPGFRSELDDLLGDLQAELSLVIDGVRSVSPDESGVED